VKPLFGADSSIARGRAAAADRSHSNGGAKQEQEHQLAPRAVATDLTASHPEIYVGAAFAAGVALAFLARRLGR